MTGEIPPGFSSGADALALSPRDNVATVLRPVACGEEIIVHCAGQSSRLTAIQAIPFGHKICLTPLGALDVVRKYGESIGHAVAAIAAGAHVHVHNMRGDRGQR